MGASVSALNHVQSAELTKQLREKYEAYKSHGFSDEEIHAKLTTDYQAILQKVQSASTIAPKVGLGKHVVKSGVGGSKRLAPSEGLGKPSSRTAAAAAAGGASGAGAGKNTRRRSFDATAANRKPVPPPAVPSDTNAAASKDAPSTVPLDDQHHPPLTGVASDVAIQNAHIVVDSWDSVTTQPYCNICQMAFKSESFLQRHVKYSDLHITNAKKLAEGQTTLSSHPTASDASPSNPISTPAGEDRPSSATLAPVPLQPDVLQAVNTQIEGVHFRLMYTGSKFFWRTQDNVDLHIYHHLLAHSIEVVGYDTTRDREMNRLYLDYTSLWDSARHHFHSTSQDPRPILEEEAKRNVVITYLLQRLQIQAPVTHTAHALLDPPTSVSVPLGVSPTTSSAPSLYFVKLTGDEQERSPVLDKPPAVLIPVVITRRRRTNAEEIEATISKLADDRKELVEATERAEKIASLVYSSANQLAAKKWWADLSRWRRLWIWAIRRIIRQKLVAETRANLAEREKAKKKAMMGKRTSLAV